MVAGVKTTRKDVQGGHSHRKNTLLNLPVELMQEMVLLMMMEYYSGSGDECGWGNITGRLHRRVLVWDAF